MRDFQNMKQSITGDDPLSKEIILFKKKREQADMIEQIFRTIKNNYNRTEINAMKTVIDKKLSQDSPIYNRPVANGYFSRIKNDLSNRAFQSPEYVEDRLINQFHTEETRSRAAAFNRPTSPATLAASASKPQIVVPADNMHQGIRLSTRSCPSFADSPHAFSHRSGGRATTRYHEESAVA